MCGFANSIPCFREKGKRGGKRSEESCDSSLLDFRGKCSVYNIHGNLDAGTLGITVFNGFMATPEALSERRELVKAAWEVYYLTWQWCNESEENMDEAVALYLESCENEGIACDEHIAEEVMGYYACPTVSEVAKLMSEASPDDAGLYTSRDLLQAEKDLLVTMDFLISIGKYSEEDRNTILDNEMTDGSIAAECLADMDALGVQYN